METPPNAAAETPPASSSGGAAAIEVSGLKKSFGHRWALRGVDLRVTQGEFLALFGPNGAGKTTLIRIMAHLLRPTQGKVRIAGIDLAEGDAAIRRRIGVISHQTFLYPNLTGRENLQFYGSLFEVERLEQRVEELLAEVELTSRANSAVRTYSKGMTQRLAIARAILHDPVIILLDEPFSGLDQHAADLLTGMLRRLHDGRRTLLMTTHNLEQGLELADRVAIQVAGRVVREMPRQGLTAGALRDIYLELTRRPTKTGGGTAYL